MTTQARKTQRAGARKAASKNGSSRSAAARPDQAPPDLPKREINAVVLHRVFLDDGGFSVVPEPIGDVKSTEVETIIANALENWKKTIRPRKD